MADVPKDIMEAAFEVWKEVNNLVGEPSHKKVAAIASALLAERERRTPAVVTDRQVRVALEAFTRAVNDPVMIKCERCDGRGYHHGFGENGHDPDWCMECGGGQFVVAPGEEGRAMRIALEAASLSSGAGRSEERG